MYIETIDFKNKFYKMDKQIFTIIRPLEKLKELGKTKLVCLTLNREFFSNAKIIGKTKMKISNIPFIVLRHDVEFQGFTIKSRKEFVNLLNLFYSKGNRKRKFHSHSKVAIIQLEKMDPKKQKQLADLEKQLSAILIPQQAAWSCPRSQYDSCGLHCAYFELGDPNRCLSKEGVL